MKLIVDDQGAYIISTEGIDLSLSFGIHQSSVCAWYLDAPVIEPVQTESFIGSVEKGAPVNFNNIFFNPHAHVTHTESMGHITKEFHSVNSIVHPLFYKALLVTVSPEIGANGDAIITRNQLERKMGDQVDALIIRTLPNDDSKKSKNYSNSNPPFVEMACVELLNEKGVNHVLIDLPSVDKEEDGGVLAFHHAFWQVPHQPQSNKSITEMIFVPDTCLDGEYLLNLQMAPIENDASPSRPVIYKIHKP